jgi:hypothetical protein
VKRDLLPFAVALAVALAMIDALALFLHIETVLK